MVNCTTFIIFIPCDRKCRRLWAVSEIKINVEMSIDSDAFSRPRFGFVFFLRSSDVVSGFLFEGSQNWVCSRHSTRFIAWMLAQRMDLMNAWLHWKNPSLTSPHCLLWNYLDQQRRGCDGFTLSVKTIDTVEDYAPKPRSDFKGTVEGWLKFWWTARNIPLRLSLRSSSAVFWTRIWGLRVPRQTMEPLCFIQERDRT